MTMAVDRKVSAELVVTSESEEPNKQGKKLITGINTSQQSVESGSNDHARVYSYEDDK